MELLLNFFRGGESFAFVTIKAQATTKAEGCALDSVQDKSVYYTWYDMSLWIYPPR